jgi:hypothetical protein
MFLSKKKIQRTIEDRDKVTIAFGTIGRTDPLILNFNLFLRNSFYTRHQRNIFEFVISYKLFLRQMKGWVVATTLNLSHFLNILKFTFEF